MDDYHNETHWRTRQKRGEMGREREIPNDIKLLSLRYEMKRKLHAYEIFRQMMLGANQSHE